MLPQATQPQTETAILARLFQAREGDLSPEAARYLLAFRFDERDIERVNVLSEMAQLGTLSATDEAELHSYIHVGNLLSIMQSRARMSLMPTENR